MLKQTVDVKDWIDNRPVSSYQWLILCLCFLIVLFDGFDVAVMGFIAPSLMQDWGLSRAAFGPVMSAGMVGLAIGALTAGPQREQLRFDTLGITCAVLSGTLASAIGYAIWYWVRVRMTALSAGAVQLSVPVLSAVLGVLLLSEGISWLSGGYRRRSH